MNLPAAVPEDTSKAIRELSREAEGTSLSDVRAQQSRGIGQAQGLIAERGGGPDLGGPDNSAMSEAIRSKYGRIATEGLERAKTSAQANSTDQYVRKLNTASTLASEEQRLNFERALLKRKMKAAKKAARGALVGNVLGIVGGVAGGVLGMAAGPAGAAIGAQAGMALGSGVGNAVGGS